MKLFVSTLFLLISTATLCAFEMPKQIDDANLHSVQFVDSLEGWAVGDEGVILHTIDGGSTWEPQKSGVLASLWKVQFINPYSGWIVGSQMDISGQSVGILLTTSDGGLNWQSTSSSTHPGLHSLAIQSDGAFLVAGDRSPTEFTNLFQYNKQRRSWTAIPGHHPGQVIAAASNQDVTVIGGTHGRLQRVREGKVYSVDVEKMADATIAAITFSNGRFFAVGSQGIMLRSTDGEGSQWADVETNLSEEMNSCINWKTITHDGDHLWVAGNPGSIVLHSSDAGKSWEVQKTGWHGTIESMHFSDEKFGIAVGSLGTILRTVDGGKSWKPIRNGKYRNAMLLIAWDLKDIDPALLAKWGHEEGFRVQTWILNDLIECEKTLKSSIRHAGGSDLSVSTHPNQEMEKRDTILNRIVLEICNQQPDVVLIPNSNRSEQHRTLHDIVKLAFRQSSEAANPLLQQLGLPLATPRKLIVEASGTKLIHHDLEANSDILGSSPRMVTADLIALFGCDTSRSREFQIIALRGDDRSQITGIWDGLNILPGSASRRRTSSSINSVAPTKKHDDAMLAIQTFRESIRTGDTTLVSVDSTIAHYSSQLKQLPGDLAVVMGSRLLDDLIKVGQWEAARELQERMIKEYPDDPKLGAGIAWLINYQSSGEVRRRLEQKHRIEASVKEYRGKKFEKPGLRNNIQTSGEVKPEEAHIILARHDQVGLRETLESVLGLEERFRTSHPRTFDASATQLALLSARRQLGRWEDVKKTSEAFLTRIETSSLEELTLEESALLQEALLMRNGPGGKLPRPLLRSRATATKPYLDGLLDDDCWHEVPEKLLNGNEKLGTKMRVTHDDQFIYLAMTCLQESGAVHPEKPEKRRRDESLEGHDRVRIELDLDRDYRSAYHLEVDERGCTRDDCWGDKTWNPRWYVAVHHEPGSWTTEIAIPFSDISGLVPNSGSIWGFNLQRTLPNGTIQKWSGMANQELRSEEMGLLQWISEETRKPVLSNPMQLKTP
jgi:photosystem II stability/assembly factor-like uncharacterized protein